MQPLAGALQLLRPTPSEVVAVAQREADVRFVRSFVPICAGPVVATAALLLIGLAGAVAAPFRLARRLMRGRR